MDRCFRLALTGTPGVGKTTISSLLIDVGYHVETVQDIAEGLVVLTMLTHRMAQDLSILTT